ncbi:uncharacterized protein BO72DRAFT_67048 [Aspergillus fijiensis CBS 313.89]|uniref:Uncharacterized protein n=1 Tax=Aspergillus fijiensis CBS 313.89 TaxID=1448319 RepID=A0A8G1RW64_9EURO|nr:uncharacterized protein BO72DRAFT_67048 [Aspergillus fijiensis CBS 313.89]RAK78641.1 hypothetical protein BO72DRAFT_67048 [Aspergillus fijiensis CBS 313.89]
MGSLSRLLRKSCKRAMVHRPWLLPTSSAVCGCEPTQITSRVLSISNGWRSKGAMKRQQETDQTLRRYLSCRNCNRSDAASGYLDI